MASTLSAADIDAELKRRAGASQDTPAQPAGPAAPSSMTLDDLNAALQRNGQQPLPPGTQLPSPTSEPAPAPITHFGRFHTVPSTNNDAESYLRFGKGLQDPLDAGAQLLTRALPTGLVNTVNSGVSAINNMPILGPITKAMGIVPGDYNSVSKSISDREKTYQQDRGPQAGTFDGYRLLGNVGANAPLAYVLPGSGANTIRGALAAGGVAGGASGALTPVTDNPSPDNFWSEKLQQIGAGAATGAVTGGTLKGGERLLSPKVAPNISLLMSRGVTPTPGQVLGPTASSIEEKLTSIPGIGDAIKSGQKRAISQFNTASYNEALNPIGQQAPAGLVGHEGVEYVKDALSNAYQKLLPKMSFQADQQFLGDVGNLKSMVGMLPDEQSGQFNKILNQIVAKRLSNTGYMDGETLKGVESELNTYAKGYQSDPHFNNRQLGNAVDSLQQSIRDTLTRSNPQYAAELTNINRGYANYARIRQAASSLGTSEGVYTPAQLNSAVKASDKSVGKGNFATGNALMQDLSRGGKSVLGSKVPDSGTTGRYLAALLAGGGLGYVSPAALGTAGAASLAYTPMGQKLIANLLAGQRSNGIRELATILGRANPAISQAAVTGLFGRATGSNP